MYTIPIGFRLGTRWYKVACYPRGFLVTLGTVLCRFVVFKLIN